MGHLKRRRVFQPLEPTPETREDQQKELASVARNPEQHAIQQELGEILAAAVDSLPCRSRLRQTRQRYAPRFTLTARPRNSRLRSIRPSDVGAKLGASGLKHDGTSGANSPYSAIWTLRA